MARDGPALAVPRPRRKIPDGQRAQPPQARTTPRPWRTVPDGQRAQPPQARTTPRPWRTVPDGQPAQPLRAGQPPLPSRRAARPGPGAPASRTGQVGLAWRAGWTWWPALRFPARRKGPARQAAWLVPAVQAARASRTLRPEPPAAGMRAAAGPPRPERTAALAVARQVPARQFRARQFCARPPRRAVLAWPEHPGRGPLPAFLPAAAGRPALARRLPGWRMSPARRIPDCLPPRGRPVPCPVPAP